MPQTVQVAVGNLDAAQSSKFKVGSWGGGMRAGVFNFELPTLNFELGLPYSVWGVL
jgi:hypothetical protein